MEELEALRRAIIGFLKSKELEVFEDVKVPHLSKLNVSEIAIQLYTTYHLLKSGRKELADKMFHKGFRVDLIAWHKGRKVPAFAIMLSKRPDEDKAKTLDDVAAYYKLMVHLDEAEPKKVGRTIIISYRDLEEYIGTMLDLLAGKAG